MSATAQHQTWFEDIVDDASVPDSNLTWLNTSRQQARDNLAGLPLPSRQQEAWRYANVDTLFRQRYRFEDVQFTALDDHDVDSWVYDDESSYRVVFANGRCVPALSNISDLSSGIVIGSLRAVMLTDPELVNSLLAQHTWTHTDRFSELNRALMNDGLVVFVPEHTVLDRPIEVVYLNIASEQQTLSVPHTVIALQAGARARIIERFTSIGDSDYLFNGVSEISMAAGAELQHVRIQSESRQAHHLSRVYLSQAEDSVYRGVNIASGGAWSRSDIYADILGQRARCELDGLYLVGDGQLIDNHLDVQHLHAGASSRENYRGIAYGKGRAVFDGRILVDKVAQKTDAQLSNRNLLLVENAEIDTKPQLEIYADDVKCSHGTTVGRIDPSQLFYLRSRGIAENEARKMLCLGFADQVLSAIDDELVRDFVQAEITRVLGSEVNR